MYMVKKKKKKRRITIGRIKGHERQHLKTSPTRALKRQGGSDPCKTCCDRRGCLAGSVAFGRGHSLSQPMVADQGGT